MRAAIYARYSSDLQQETSIDDQLAVARRFAADHGWRVLKDHVYSDSAVSGASINGRAGIQSLLAAVAQRPKPFDVVLVDDSSRVTDLVMELLEGETPLESPDEDHFPSSGFSKSRQIASASTVSGCYFFTRHHTLLTLVVDWRSELRR